MTNKFFNHIVIVIMCLSLAACGGKRREISTGKDICSVKTLSVAQEIGKMAAIKEIENSKHYLASLKTGIWETKTAIRYWTELQAIESILPGLHNHRFEECETEYEHALERNKELMSLLLPSTTEGLYLELWHNRSRIQETKEGIKSSAKNVIKSETVKALTFLGIIALVIWGIIELDNASSDI